MNPLSNFIGSVRDLQRCAWSSEQYDLLRIPGILRLLLLDGLVDQVNREIRHKLQFRIGRSVTVQEGPISTSAIMFQSVADSFDPEVVPELTTPRDVDRKRFLASVILVVEGAPVTVLELIQNLAYVHGLTHPGEAKTEKDEHLLVYRRILEVGGAAAGLKEIAAIGRVAYRALTPIMEKGGNANANGTAE